MKQKRYKPPYRIGQVWAWDDGWDDGYGFTIKIIKINPLTAQCIKTGDSSWKEGDIESIPDSICYSAHCILEPFSTYLTQVELLNDESDSSSKNLFVNKPANKK